MHSHSPRFWLFKPSAHCYDAPRCPLSRCQYAFQAEFKQAVNALNTAAF
ncbi:hypothetical protein HMPREF0541_00805 [Lacticaseibacillus rhamnosus ATCC 21052]|nr:hypothetical protein HMPREF0541_00805 [Lacticaseibacillus rhamnosus ATCC 21052]